MTKNVEPYEIVAGNPARVVRSRYNHEDIATLLDVQWWNWPIEQVAHYAATILAGTLEGLAVLPDSPRGIRGQ